MRKTVITAIFFLLTPLTLATSMFSIVALAQTPEVTFDNSLEIAEQIYIPRSGVQVYASLPGGVPGVYGVASVSDARGEIVRQYLERYNSPLEPYSNVLVETADKYGLDFRLTTAIAQQESNLCKIIPPLSYNCWGWGIHSEGSLGFDSYPQAINTVSQGIREEYIDKGYTTIEEIMSKYTPQSNGSWAIGVIDFMEEMK